MSRVATLNKRTRRKYNSTYVLYAVVDGSYAAYEYCGARGVWNQQSAGLIFEPPQKRHADWYEIHAFAYRRPYLIWKREDFVVIEPVVCLECNHEVEPQKTKDERHINKMECQINKNRDQRLMIEDSPKELN